MPEFKDLPLPKLTVEPLHDRVVIRALPEETMTPGGLHIPDVAKEKPVQGEVIAVGPGRWERGQLVPMSLRVGDRVIYGKYTGTQVELEGETLILLRETDVLGKVVTK